MWSAKKTDTHPVSSKNGLLSNLDAELKDLPASHVLVLQSKDHMLSLARDNSGGFFLYDENRTPATSKYNTSDELIKSVKYNFGNPGHDEFIKFSQYQNVTLSLAISMALNKLKSETKTNIAVTKTPPKVSGA